MFEIQPLRKQVDQGLINRFGISFVIEINCPFWELLMFCVLCQRNALVTRDVFFVDIE